MSTQDWEPVVIKRSNTVRKAPGGSNLSTKPVNMSQDAAYLRKIENSDNVKIRQLSGDARKELTQRRVALGKTQVQLNNDCKFGLNIIRDIESGKYCPLPQQLGVLNRVLRCNVKFD
jgi:ribosome-binding protein aMBF1 (putative translation factor)